MPDQELEEKKPLISVRSKGVAKIFGGAMACAFAPLVSATGFFVGVIGGAALATVGGGVCEIMARRAEDEETKQEWQERRKNCVGYGASAIALGGIMAVPYLFGASYLIEGLGNAVTGKDEIGGYKLGVLPIVRKIGGLVSGRPLYGSPGYEEYNKGLEPPQSQIPSPPQLDHQATMRPQKQVEGQATGPRWTPNPDTVKKIGDDWVMDATSGEHAATFKVALGKDGKLEVLEKVHTSQEKAHAIRKDGLEPHSGVDSSLPNNKERDGLNQVR